jgi:hypothetical protein
MRALLFLLALAVAGCPAGARPPCDEAKLRAIDADYVAKVSKACLREYPDKESCPAWPALKVEHKQRLNAECGVK